MLNEDQESSEEPEGHCAVWKFHCSMARCPYKTNRPYNLWRHEESHSNPKEQKLFACPACIYSTDKVSNLKRHVATKHPGANDQVPVIPPPDRNGKIQCQVMGCRYETNRPYDLRRHLMVHNNPEKSHKTFKCSLCTYSSDRKANLKRHHELRHSGIEEAIQTAEELSREWLLKENSLEEHNISNHEQEMMEQVMEVQKVEVDRLEEQLEREDVQLRPWVPAMVPETKKNLNSLVEDLVFDDHAVIKLENVYEAQEDEQMPLITISTCNPQILQGDISNKQVIAVNVNGQLRWFQSIDPPPGAPTKLPVEKPAPQPVSEQQRMDELDDELALSLPEHDQQEEFLVEMLPEETHTEQPTQKELGWSWSTPHEELKTDDADANFPDWWDDGKYTKKHKNQTFRDQPKKPSQANVQRILRIIYDVYYKPFKEDRKQFEAFQVKDSWLCATGMTRMQIIKDMYSKQGT
ncbi:uncharacterized protein LOC108098286 [Drosophila ficusphila]|uniref:uncharacterized protein LOC108098286 n=1 Tax=Drosophila ficusphila TaxID=30025 RepID=UPI0007E69AF0|nr:uncharacterized protein LOC108098286 [Drosophila ficusphila]